MIAPAWLAQLLEVDGEIEDEELAGRLAQRLRLQVPTGPEGVRTLTRFALLAETLYRRPDELVEEALPDSLDEASAAASQLGLRTRSDLERVLRLAAKELWAYLSAQAPAAPQQGRRPSSPRNRTPEEEERLAAFAAQAIAEARGEKPPAPPAPHGPDAVTPEARLEQLAAEAIAEARAEKGPQLAAAPPAPEPPAPAAEMPVPAAPAAAGPPKPRNFNEQLEAAGPLIVFLATVGGATIIGLLIWLIGTAIGVFGNGNV